MPHKDWCGKPCYECSSPCALDESLPCSPSCDYLGLDGETNSKQCEGCPAINLED